VRGFLADVVAGSMEIPLKEILVLEKVVFVIDKTDGLKTINFIYSFLVNQIPILVIVITLM